MDKTVIRSIDEQLDELRLLKGFHDLRHILLDLELWLEGVTAARVARELQGVQSGP